MDFSPSACPKTYSPSAPKRFGMVIASREKQPENALFPMESISVGSTTERSELPENALVPMVRIESESETDSSDRKPTKARSPTEVIPSETTILRMDWRASIHGAVEESSPLFKTS